MNEILSRIIQIIRNEKTKNDYLHEASTTSLINGILYAYGWDVFNPYEVHPQYSFNDKIPDMAIKLYNYRQIYIEIKKYSKKLNNKDINQLRSYLKETNDVKFGFLTNAKTWMFFTSSQSEDNKIKISREAVVDLTNDNIFFIEEFFSKYLSKENYIDSWYQKNNDILLSDNSTDYDYGKLHAVHKLRLMKDKRVIELFEKIIIEENGDYLKSTAFDGIVELYDNNESKNDLRIFLEKSLNNENGTIKKKASSLLKSIDRK